MSRSYPAPAKLSIPGDKVSWRQLQCIYALQKRLGIKQTWDKKMSKEKATKLIASLTARTGRQTQLL